MFNVFGYVLIVCIVIIVFWQQDFTNVGIGLGVWRFRVWGLGFEALGSWGSGYSRCGLEKSTLDPKYCICQELGSLQRCKGPSTAL